MKFFRRCLRLIVINLRFFLLKTVWGMDIAKSARISFGTKLDKTNPKGVHIGNESYLASGAIVFTHDFSRSLKTDTYIGQRCFVGANAIVMAGVHIGDEVVVGSGAIVTKDVASHSVVVGNPARVIKSGIRTEKFGKIKE